MSESLDLWCVWSAHKKDLLYIRNHDCMEPGCTRPGVSAVHKSRCVEHRKQRDLEVSRESHRRKRLKMNKERDENYVSRKQGECFECGAPAWSPFAYRCMDHKVLHDRKRYREKQERYRRARGVKERPSTSKREQERQKVLAEYARRQQVLKDELKVIAARLITIIREAESGEPIRIKDVRRVGYDIVEASRNRGWPKEFKNKKRKAA